MAPIKRHNETCISSGVVSIGLENPDVSRQYLFMLNCELFADTKKMLQVLYTHELGGTMIRYLSRTPSFNDKSGI